MRTTLRSALVAGGVAVLGLAVTPAVAAIYDGPAVVRPSSVVAEARGDEGAKVKTCDGDESMTGVMRQGGPQMAALHRAHHGEGDDPGDMMGGFDMRGSGGARGSGEMAILHRAHHGEGDGPGDMMGGSDMMGGATT